jgi:putative endopeptidase
MNTNKQSFFDYFNYVNSEFISHNPIPPDQSRWGTFDILRKSNDKICMDILQSIQHDNLETIYSDILNQSDRIHLKNMYHLYQCLLNNNDNISFQTIHYILLQIKQLYFDTKLDTKTFILKCICLLNTFNIHTIFNLNLTDDPKNQLIQTLLISEGGLHLPETIYYTSKDTNIKKVRYHFRKYIYKLFQYLLHNHLLDDIIDVSSSEIPDLILKIEKKIASCFDTIEDRNNVDKFYNKLLLINDLPFFDWNIIFDLLNVPNRDVVLNNPFWIRSPNFFNKLNQIIDEITKKDWYIYFIFTIIQNYVPLFEKEHSFLSTNYFHYIQKIKGQKKRKDIQYRQYIIVNDIYGFLISKIYNHFHFNLMAQNKMNDMIKNIKQAFKNRLLHFNKWMCDESKQKAITKLENMKWKIGIVHEDSNFPVYPQITIPNDCNDIISIIITIEKFYYHYYINRHLQPRLQNEWGAFPHVVNAYYDSSNNEMTFPSGILQKPFFSFEYDDSRNYGGIGCVIGHELTHAFDSNGSKYNENGEYKLWWTKNDIKQFNNKKKVIEDIYSIHSLHNLPLNGVLTSGENIADIGGVRIALEALKLSVSNQLNYDLFFRSYTICECNYKTKQSEIIQLTNDEHSPSIFRVNVVLNYFPEFLDYLLDYKLVDKNNYKFIDDFKKRIDMNIEIW